MSSNFYGLPPFFAGGPFIRLNLLLPLPANTANDGNTTFTGDIPLLLPFRGYTRQDVLPDVSLVEKAATELIGFGRALWPDDEDETILSKLRDYALAGALMGLGPSKLHYKTWVRTLTLVIGMDDELDNAAEDERVDVWKEFADMCRTPNSMFDRPIPRGHQKIARMSPEFEALNRDLHVIPLFRKKLSQGMRQECFLYCASHVVQTDLKKQGQVFSRSNTRDLLRHASGWNMGVEMLLILHDVRVPPSVREEVAFSIVQNNLSDIGMLTNSLFGLPRDLKLGQQDSSIMQDVKSGRMSLLPAIEKTYMDLLDAMHDLKLATELLIRAHDGDQHVAKYVQIVREYVDGILYGYKFWERYGISDKVTLFEK